MNEKEVKKIANKAVAEEKALAKLEQEFALQNAEFAKFLKKQTATNAKIAAMWSSVKNSLVEMQYFDILENDNFRVSVSKVLGIKVTDIEKLPAEYTETVKVAKSDKIKKHFELYDKLPAGTVDNSYYRLNKKVK